MTNENRRRTDERAPRLRAEAWRLAEWFAAAPASPGHGGSPAGGGHAPGSGSRGHGGSPATPGHGGSAGGGGHRMWSLGSASLVTDTSASGAGIVTHLVPIEIASIYESGGQPVKLPERMAWCTPDMFAAIERLDAELRSERGRLVVSDLFRTYDMQLQAHLDWRTRKKSAYSPPPGESMHEAGRAFDLDLGRIGVGLGELWTMAAACGLSPIIASPDPSADEAWHFDARGSHDAVYRLYESTASGNMKPYTAMSISAVLAIGGRVDRFSQCQDEAAVQCALIRLGFNPGLIDGLLGPRSRAALSSAGVVSTDPASMREELEKRLEAAFPLEYRIGVGPAPLDHIVPDHIIP